MHLVLGLGNPGRRYERTRHNIGFLVADRLTVRWGERVLKPQFGAEVARIVIRGHETVVGKPQSFMNLSGQPAASLRGFFKVDVPNVIVVHDELDIPFGEVRLKLGGGHGGHNGLRDIQAKFGEGGFVRVRFGIGRPPPGWQVADYVLAPFSILEESQLAGLLDRAVDAVESVICDGIQAAMNVYNAKPKVG
jgi:PTH1 family peptidyl-tRNA hydrolase